MIRRATRRTRVTNKLDEIVDYSSGEMIGDWLANHLPDGESFLPFHAFETSVLCLHTVKTGDQLTLGLVVNGAIEPWRAVVQLRGDRE